MTLYVVLNSGVLPSTLNPIPYHRYIAPLARVTPRTPAEDAARGDHELGALAVADDGDALREGRAVRPLRDRLLASTSGSQRTQQLRHIC